MCFKDHCNGADYERQTLWNDGPCLRLQWAYWGESVSVTMTRQYRVIEGYEWVLCHCPDRRGHPAYVAAVLSDKVTQDQSKWTWRSHCHTHTLSLRRCSMEHTASIFIGQRKIVLPLTLHCLAVFLHIELILPATTKWICELSILVYSARSLGGKTVEQTDWGLSSLMNERSLLRKGVRHPSANGMIYICMSQAMHIRNEKNLVAVGVQFAGRRKGVMARGDLWNGTVVWPDTDIH